MDDVSAQEEVVAMLKKSMDTANLPHMLFYGPPGTGKTSTILAITHQMYGPLWKKRVLELNASDERGIKIVRTKIKDFAQIAVSSQVVAGHPCPPYKVRPQACFERTEARGLVVQRQGRGMPGEYSPRPRPCPCLERRGLAAGAHAALRTAEAPSPQVIILDEADAMTNDAQVCASRQAAPAHLLPLLSRVPSLPLGYGVRLRGSRRVCAQTALRRTMETYATVTRFCIICNYVSRIIQPLASRCAKFRFRPLLQATMRGRLDMIAAKEGVKVDEARPATKPRLGLYGAHS